MCTRAGIKRLKLHPPRPRRWCLMLALQQKKSSACFFVLLMGGRGDRFFLAVEANLTWAEGYIDSTR